MKAISGLLGLLVHGQPQLADQSANPTDEELMSRHLPLPEVVENKARQSSICSSIRPAFWKNQLHDMRGVYIKTEATASVSRLTPRSR